MSAVPERADPGASPRPPTRGDRAGRWLRQWTALLARHRATLTAVLLAMGGLFSWLSRGVVWQPDVLAFFSAQSEDVRAMRAAADAPGVATQLRFDVHARPGAADDRTAPDAAVRAAAQDLARRLGAGGDAVWTGVDATRLAAAYGGLVSQASTLLSDAERAEVVARATPAALAARFDAVQAHLADPDGEILLRRLAADPLDLATVVTRRLSALAPVRPADDTDAEVSLRDGLLTARDAAGGLHVMLVMQPRTPPSDGRAAEITLTSVLLARQAVEASHPGVEVWVVGAHRGYVENARRIKSDVGAVSLLGTWLVAGAIFFYFRRARRGGVGIVLLCLAPPAVGVGLALGLAGLARAELPLILLGFAGLLSGSTTDYGIQIIDGCQRLARRQSGWTDDVPAAAARALLGPISLSVATSVTGFAALGLSEAPGLRALGLFVAAATLCIWAVTFLVLPAYIGPWVMEKRPPAVAATPLRRTAGWGGLAIFLVGTLWLGRAALGVRFNTDPRALDGGSARMRAEEDGFYRVWGDLRNRAVVLVRGQTADDALAALGRMSGYLADLRQDGLVAGVLSPASLLPDQETAAARAAAWNAYWTADRTDELRTQLRAAAQARGWRPDGFAAYANRVGGTSPAPAQERLAASPAALFPGLIDERPGEVTLTTVVQMLRVGSHPGGVSLRRSTGWAAELRLRYPDATILSGNVLMFDATERARAEGERLAPWCVLAILIPLWIYFRRLRTAWLVLGCLVVGLLWVLGAAQVFTGASEAVSSGGLNILALVPVLFTLGVTVDYGIYAASDPVWRAAQPAAPADRDSRSSATFLCALTTILGSGALAFAQHPALRWLGVTLVAGLAGGYLASVYLVAPLTRRRFARAKAPKRLAWQVTGWLPRLALGAMTLLLMVPPAVEWLLSRQKPAGVASPGVHPPVRQVAPRTFVAGDSWLRWRPAAEAGAAEADASGLWELLLAGSPEDRGYATAKLAGPLDVRIENEMLDQLDHFLPQAWSRWLVLRGMGANLVDLPRYVAAEDQQEIYWAATFHNDPHAYLAPSYPRILSYHALHDISQMLIDNPLIVPNSFACTGVVSLPTYTAPAAGGPPGHLLLARNFDFEGGESFGRQKSVTYVVPPAGQGIPFAHVAWPGLSGAVTGMNARQIALFINAAATGDFRRIGTPTILMARDVLQHAASIDEAEAIIRRTPVFVSDILVVADGKTGRARVFEKSPADTAAYDVAESAVVANHLITPRFRDDPVNRERKADGTTTQREARARQLLGRLAHQVTPAALAGLLRDKQGLDDKPLGWGNRNAVDGLIACHSVIMDATAGKMWVAAWPYAEGAFVEIDVLRMLNAAAAGKAELWRETPTPVSTSLPQDSIVERPPTAGSRSDWDRVLAARAAAEAAVAALRAGRSRDALAAAEETVRDNPAFYLGHELRGRALLQLGDRAGAKAALEQALRQDPPYAQRRAALEGLIHQCDTSEQWSPVR
jgi:predicted exporter